MKKIITSIILISVAYCARSQNPLLDIKKYNEGQAFTCITVDSNRNVWAGTDKAGIFYLNKKLNANATFNAITTAGSSDLLKIIIQSVAADKLGNVWIGHGGQGGLLNAGGGMEQFDINSGAFVKHYIPDRNAECYTFFARDGLATLNVTCVTVDKYNTVWAAQGAHSLTSGSDFILTPGSLSSKPRSSAVFRSKSTWQDYKNGNEAPEFPYPAYTCNVPATKTPGARQCQSVACSSNEVWVSVYGYEYTKERKAPGKEVETEFFPARILVYGLAGDFHKEIRFETVGATPGGVFNAIYLTDKGNAWLGLTAGKGIATQINGCWKLLNSQNLPGILDGAAVNKNAIWGNKKGQVFIGTNKGMIVYNGVGKIDDPLSYTLYNTTTSPITSNNITGGIMSEKDTCIWVATDNGIMRIKSENDFSLDDNYTRCKDKDINEIEAQSFEDLSNRMDYHLYTITTEICDKSGPNGSNCNAQYVYNLMKSDASLQAPSPDVFPYDVPVGLMELSEAEKHTIETNVNNWKESLTQGNEFGGIKYIHQIFKDIPTIEILSEVEEKFSRAFFIDEQQKYNSKSVISCDKIYRLYSGTSAIIGREGYNLIFDPYCGNKLKSVQYDEVKIFADDKNLTIVNYAIEGHILNPGKIHRSVVEECGKVKVITTGSGLNYCGKYGSPRIGRMNGSINILIGSILFKNVDIKLKRAFEN